MAYNLITELKLAEKAVINYYRYKNSLDTFRENLLCEMEGTADDYVYSKELNVLAHPDNYEFDKVKAVVLELLEKYPSVDFEY